MNRFKNLMWCLSAVLISAVLLLLIYGVEKRLNDITAKHNLHFTGQIKNAPPIVAFTTVALGSFRGLLADIFWLRASALQDEGKYFEMVQLADWVTKLQPRFSGATAYLAWNMAYNISVTCSSFEDRWRWIQRGIELLRDQAIEYNPTDPLLYKELGWIYQHKIGNIMDDANLYYKNQMALTMMKIVGESPDWKKLAAAPVDAAAFKKEFPPAAPFWAALNDAGLDSLNALLTEFKKTGTLPEALLKKLNDPAVAEKVTVYLRAAWLREALKLDPRLIEKINQQYGALDWRLPESQAIYWAAKGLEMTPGHHDIACERMISQALKELFAAGKLLLVDQDNFSSILTVPNLNVAEAVKRTFEEAYIKNDKAESFRSALINFLKEATVTLYNYGNYTKAKQFYEYLRKEEPGAYRLPLDNFVLGEWVADLKDASPKKANDAISGMLYQSINFLVFGDMDAALAHEKVARYIYNVYKTTHEDTWTRSALPPYAEIKETITKNCLKGFPAPLVKILKAKLQEQAAQKKDEETVKAAPEEAVPNGQDASLKVR